MKKEEMKAEGGRAALRRNAETRRCRNAEMGDAAALGVAAGGISGFRRLGPDAAGGGRAPGGDRLPRVTASPPTRRREGWRSGRPPLL